jgi:hypothetical protein
VIYFCCSDLRRTLIQGSANFNGIDFLEVLDDPSTPPDQVQRTLFVHFVNPLTVAIGQNNVRIEGGERMRDIHVASVAAGDDADVLAVRVDRAGDFSTYTLRLVADASNLASETPPAGIDPALAAVDFSFKAACDTHVDCLVAPSCPPEALDEPEIDYLAKDYASFRQVIRDRMSVILPGWTEQNPADVGVMLTEVLAYVGDYLSYQQDAVATEAYLDTAARRISVRRHARLVDYFMHDGSNARVWVQVRVDSDLIQPKALAAKTKLLTQVPGLQLHIAPKSKEWLDALNAGAVVFEVMADVDHLLVDLNQLLLYTWGSEDCCLPAGATSATLLGAHPGVKVGDVLIFQEVLGPETLLPQDADPSHRAAVRLTSVEVTQDPVTAANITEIAWAAEDALPFPFAVRRSDLKGPHDVSVALGNIVLADHGRTIDDLEPLGAPAAPSMFLVPGPGPDPCHPAARSGVPARFNPRLRERPLTRVAPSPVATQSAASAFRWKLADVLPSIEVHGPEPKDWAPRRDLIGSSPTAQDFVAEADDDGAVSLRFGDGIRFGAEPKEGEQYQAKYRVGNGAGGNVGWESIAHVVGADPAISRVWNPLPASGGVDPESLEEVRQRAPYAFQLEQLRAVTPEDYATFAMRYPHPNSPEVRKAEGTFRWTGSWYTVLVTPDRAGGKAVDDPFRSTLRLALEPYRMAGHDLEVEAPIYMPLELDMTVCVSDDHFKGDVQKALLGIFNNRILPDGRQGLFHPDRFTFGQTVYLSPFVAAAQGVDGVQSVRVDKFQRWGVDSNQALDAGALKLQALEIARLDADPSFPDRGVFVLRVEGGK